jgi:hypothetical protein
LDEEKAKRGEYLESINNNSERCEKLAGFVVGAGEFLPLGWV